MSARSRNSYHAGYRPSQIAHHEWRNAENSAAYLLPTLERLTKVNPGLKLLDVGAGSGTITASLAKYIPQGSLVATDISDEVLARAESFARAAGATNVTCQKADIYNLPFPNASFDVTHASQVLCHLSRPEEALAEMMRVTKPGGVVACRESDLRTVCVWPDLPEIMQTYDLIARVMEQGGGHGKGGRQLVSWAMRAGIPRDHIKFSYGSWTYAEPADREVWARPTMERLIEGPTRQRALAGGIATEADIDKMIDGWQRWVAAEDGSLGMMQGEMIIEVV